MLSSFRRFGSPRISTFIAGTLAASVCFFVQAVCAFAADVHAADAIRVEEDAETIRIETNALKATIRKKGYVSGIAGGTFIDKKTGQADLGFGLDIVDWVMAPGSDDTACALSLMHAHAAESCMALSIVTRLPALLSRPKK